MNDEGDFSEHVPDDLKCDACKLLAKKLTEKFDYIHKRRPSVRRLKESDILTVTEAVCNGPFDDYGVKEVNKVMRLSGPGLETNGLPGVTQSGGKWPHRLLKMCNGYLGELDEIEIYEKYKKYGTLETYMCYGSGVRGECSRTKNFTKGRHEL
ncbi:marginal zone B- and B1-cell-specific protein-like [Liolophura sinensis]|uniref:marginal zone B- and B1-cell-specific protein-like n=1 Tax=Liolophura sinensis TaxID=3198878 RepID=UPI0031588742